MSLGRTSVTLSGQTVSVDLREILRALRERPQESELSITPDWNQSAAADAEEASPELHTQNNEDFEDQQETLNRQDSGIHHE